MKLSLRKIKEEKKNKRGKKQGINEWNISVIHSNPRID